MACSEEVFGPVMAVVAFTTDDEAVALANDCPFGLGSSVFSRNTARAQGLGSRIEVRKRHLSILWLPAAGPIRDTKQAGLLY